MKPVIHSKLKLKGRPQQELKRAKPDEEVAVNIEGKSKAVIEQPIKKGIGKIITSCNTVHGMNTEFQKQLDKGDKIIVGECERVISFILSNKSLSLEEGFPVDIVTNSEFSYRNKPIEIDKMSNQEIIDSKIKKDEGPQYKVVEMRTTGGLWTYKKMKKVLDTKISKEDELDIRVKNISDKFCWI